MKVRKLSWTSFIGLISVFEKRPWSILSWSSGIIAASFILWYGLQIPLGNPSIGAQFVLSEWPDPKISPYFYAKPITWFSYFGFMYWAFGLESNRSRFLNMSPRIRRFISVITATIGFAALYEIFFNFTLWGSLLTITQCPPSPQPCNPDVLANSFPELRNPVNLVFATKVVTTVFGLSVYSLWFLHHVERELEQKPLTLEQR